jgi:CubicO group peptidase (beta-lactamase class C family)
MNETDIDVIQRSTVTSDSIFRIMSVSKHIAMTSALVIPNLPNQPQYPIFTLDTPVRLVLPGFTLPSQDWADGGSEITLSMLASHTSGLPRESYSTNFNMILSTDKADAATIGAEWTSVTPEDVLTSLATSNLMFAPGQRAAYSNAGHALLGSAVAAHYNNITNSNLSWSQSATNQILDPLNMTHSFFGPVPQDLEPFISVPGGDNWVDLLIGEGYNPAAGMWSSANDLARYMYALWLKPTPELITKYQRRKSLKPVAILPDGVQQVGPGWEISLLKLNTSKAVGVDDGSKKTYSIFGKSGDGGGWHSWVDVIPNLGYGLVILSQVSGLENFSSISPTTLRDTVHEILAPAFAEAIAERAGSRFAGTYTAGQDTGLLTDVVDATVSNSTTYAKIEVQDQILYLRSLIINGTSALEAIDRLSWTSESGPRYFSTPQGAVLEPAEGAAENSQFGEGSQVWRLIFPGLETCDWFDFDGYKDTRGWPLSKVVLIEKEGNVELRYPPFDVAVSRVG